MQQRGLKPTASTLGQRLGRGGGQVQRAERPSRMGFEETLGPALQRALLAAPGAGTQRLRGPGQAAGAGGGPDKRAGPQSGSRGCTRNPAGLPGGEGWKDHSQPCLPGQLFAALSPAWACECVAGGHVCACTWV